MDQTLQWLYIQLMAPIDAHLKRQGVKHLRIIPHRALQLIPFSALYYIDRSGQRHYLIDDYDIEYAPSATLQHICRERARSRTFQQSLIAVANPTGDLPFSAVEVEQLTTYFPSSSVQVWYGDSARLEAVMASKPGSVFHFSGHASYDWNDPLASHLLFARNEMLSLADLFAEAIPLPNTSLVVLSACETNITDPEDLADEYLGLASGFLFAGTPSVISTLWAVDDISTALLVTHFYQKHFIEHLSPGQALQAAQHWLRETVDRRSVMQHIQTQLEALQNQAAHAPHWSESADSIAKQIRRLKNRLDGEKKRDPNDRPFAHPYYWAAFTVSGADVGRSYRPVAKIDNTSRDRIHSKESGLEQVTNGSESFFKGLFKRLPSLRKRTT